MSSERAELDTPLLQEHFQDLEQQGHAARFGMWIFLATEILLFGGLFVGYMVYRSLFSEAFKEASKHLDATLGTIETLDLLTSSLFAVLGLHYLKVGKKGLSAFFLMLVVACGAIFLVLHGFEYVHEFHEGIEPGPFYHYRELPDQGAVLFFTLYFMMTTLHGFHVAVGVSLIAVSAAWVYKRRIRTEYVGPLEVMTLYWHLIDIIWIYLYPLLYLAG